MKSIAAAISLFAASCLAQGVTEYIAPKGNPPTGCLDTDAGTYELSVGTLNKRSESEKGATLQVRLSKGTLKDTLGRTGYIAENYQFQFDDPPQAGSLFTGGWSLCSNGSLALGTSAVFYQCLSGTFNNLYDRWWAEQCNPITILVHPVESVNIITVSSGTLKSAGTDIGTVTSVPGVTETTATATITSTLDGSAASKATKSSASSDSKSAKSSASSESKAISSSASSLSKSASAASKSAVSSASSASKGVSSSASSASSAASSMGKSSSRASVADASSSARASSSSANDAAAAVATMMSGTGPTVAMLMGLMGAALV